MDGDLRCLCGCTVIVPGMFALPSGEIPCPNCTRILRAACSGSIDNNYPAYQHQPINAMEGDD